MTETEKHIEKQYFCVKSCGVLTEYFLGGGTRSIKLDSLSVSSALQSTEWSMS